MTAAILSKIRSRLPPELTRQPISLDFTEGVALLINAHFGHLKIDFGCNQTVTSRMTSEEAEAVRTACADLVRLLRATRMCAEAAKGIERDLISIAALVEDGD
jgi:hypothetical protein